jgi:hypothetical protein
MALAETPDGVLQDKRRPLSIQSEDDNASSPWSSSQSGNTLSWDDCPC